MPVRPAPSKRGIILPSVPVPRPKVMTAEVARRPDFMVLCERMGIEPTVRQARKYLRRDGRWSSGKVFSSVLSR